jgi:predicted kinase
VTVPPPDAALLRAVTRYQQLAVPRRPALPPATDQLAAAARTAAASLPSLIVVGGLPGAGKSTLAEGLARALSAPVFAVDWQLGALAGFGAVRQDNAEAVGDVLLYANAARQLQLGLSAIIDETAHTRVGRARWQALADSLRGRFVGVECRCLDEDAHRGRISGRDRGIPGWPGTVTWEHVLWMRERWEPWDEPHLVLDSALNSPDASLRQVLTLLSDGRGGAADN